MKMIHQTYTTHQRGDIKMEIDVTEKGFIQLKKVYNPVILTTEDGESMSVCMRDNGFEITSHGITYSVEKGEALPLKVEPKVNYCGADDCGYDDCNYKERSPYGMGICKYDGPDKPIITMCNTTLVCSKMKIEV